MEKCITSCEKNEALCCSDDCFLRVAEGSRLRDFRRGSSFRCTFGGS